MTSPVIDLSHHNPTPVWSKVAAAGVIGIIHKATENTGYSDPTRGQRLADAIAAGLLVSTYHFLRPGNIDRQMDFYLSTVQPVEGERLCLDFEDDRMLLSELESAVSYLRAKRPDVQITVYSGHTIKEKLGNKVSQVLADNTSLWIAQYAPSPTWPKATWPTWSLWQWTDKEVVPGISAPVDGDKWNGTDDALRAWLSPAGSEVLPPTPKPDQAIVTVAISVTGEAAVQVTVNGETVAVYK